MVAINLQCLPFRMEGLCALCQYDHHPLVKRTGTSAYANRVELDGDFVSLNVVGVEDELSADLPDGDSDSCAIWPANSTVTIGSAIWSLLAKCSES